ncbi:hypothetical protein BCR43DRAFT_178174 [Syncephalastrum racemosum]|uniref:Uncharacterized protein n=1 Tax=Syncephalastrum racemosum TaxID=13706 RepID=A0A1X2HR98_SYNRA|nr:hypothetical protein BCR43DRAFT_178174 [Syncephalastrum racemosum]
MSTLPTHIQDVNGKSQGSRQRSFCVNKRYLRVWALVAVLCLSTVALLSHFGTPQWPQQKTPALIDEDFVAAPEVTQSSAKDEILHLTQTYPVAVWSKTYCP